MRAVAVRRPQARGEDAVSTMTRLDEDTVRELWGRYKHQGDKAARDRLILSYSPLVKYVAGRMSNGLPSHIEESDLISYGLLGLIGALERFDPAREIKFETYAISRIKGSIIDELRSLDWVPRSVRAKARAVEQSYSKLESTLHRTPVPCTTASLSNTMRIMCFLLRRPWYSTSMSPRSITSTHTHE